MTVQLSKYINYTHEKALYEGKKGYFIRIRDKYIKNATKYHKKLRITLKGKGFGIYTPEEWLENAEYTEQVFLRPNEPMKLWGNWLKIGHGLEKEKSIQLMIEDYTIPNEVRDKLKDIYRLKFA